jgi:hypothetical protein
LAIAVVFTGAIAARASLEGAKELFYNPSDDSIQSISAAQSKAGQPAGTRSSSGKPVHLGKDGRRRVDALALAAVHSVQSVPRVLGISYWIELVEGQGESGTQVTNERVFRSGERIRLHFRGNVDGHIALIHLGSSGMATVLFPDPEKQLTDSNLAADEDRILPSAAHWFRFDDNPGTERLLVLFARSREEIERFPVKPMMNPVQAQALLTSTQQIQGSKDLIVETETRKASEIGTYGVNVTGKPVVLEITLRHR